MLDAPTVGKLGMGGVAGGFMSIVAQVIATMDPHFSLDGIIQAVLGGIIVVLFGLFIRQGNQLAELRAYSKRNKDDIDKLDVESRTVDKRLQDSRHAWKNEMMPVTMSVEERAGMRIDELRERVARMESRLERHIEEAK